MELGGEAGTSGAAAPVDVATLFGEADGFVVGEQKAPEVDDDF